MLVELFVEVFFIKIKVKGYLQNITENTKENIDTFGIKNKNIICYIKELSTSIYLNILTTYLSIDEKKVEIHYKVLDSNEEYIYLIEMSER